MQRVPSLEPMRSETFPYPDRFLDGPHGPLCFFDTGDRHAHQGRTEPRPVPILMLHALGTNFTQFEYVAPVLANETRIIGVDLPGCGHSGKPRRPWRIADVTAAVLRVLDHLGLARVAVLGHSFGGRVALELALRHPHRVDGLLLLNSAGLTRFPSLYQHIGPPLLRPNLVAGLILTSFRFVLRHIFSPQARKTPHAQRFMHQVIDRYDPHYAWEFAYHFCPLLPELVTDLIDELPRIKVPTQVVWGERDQLLRLRDVRAALSRLERCELTVLPEVGHMPTLEQPDAVIEAARRLLRAIDGGPAGDGTPAGSHARARSSPEEVPA